MICQSQHLRIRRDCIIWVRERQNQLTVDHRNDWHIIQIKSIFFIWIFLTSITKTFVFQIFTCRNQLTAPFAMQIMSLQLRKFIIIHYNSSLSSIKTQLVWAGSTKHLLNVDEGIPLLELQLMAGEVGLEPTMVCRRRFWRPVQSPLCDSPMCKWWY